MHDVSTASSSLPVCVLASYAVREKIFQNHVTYQEGYHWFIANDDAVPTDIRTTYAGWGLATDEFAVTGNWPHQLYIREARRLTPALMMTQRNCFGRGRSDRSRRLWHGLARLPSFRPPWRRAQ